MSESESESESESKTWMTIDEAAQYLRITPAALRYWILRGSLRAVRVADEVASGPGPRARMRLARTELDSLAREKGWRPSCYDSGATVSKTPHCEKKL